MHFTICRFQTKNNVFVVRHCRSHRQSLSLSFSLSLSLVVVVDVFNLIQVFVFDFVFVVVVPLNFTESLSPGLLLRYIVETAEGMILMKDV